MEILPTQFRQGSRLDDVGDVAPLSLVKQALNVEDDSEDALIRQYMSSAKKWIEDAIHRPLDRYQWTATFELSGSYYLKPDDVLVLPMAPVFEVRAGPEEIYFFTRNGFDAMVPYEQVPSSAESDGKLQLEVVTDWGPEQLEGLKHPFLTICAEMYFRREATAGHKAISNVVMLALGKYQRQRTLRNE